MAECVPNRKLIAELMEKEEKRLENETPKSYELYQRAIKHMPMGVASTYHARDPYPVYFTHGKGPHIWSVEGKEIVDFHNGYGCMVQGHAHPLIVEAIQARDAAMARLATSRHIASVRELVAAGIGREREGRQAVSGMGGGGGRA